MSSHWTDINHVMKKVNDFTVFYTILPYLYNIDIISILIIGYFSDQLVFLPLITRDDTCDYEEHI